MKILRQFCSILIFTMIVTPVAVGGDKREKSSAIPFRLSEQMLAGKGLGEFGPWPEEMILKGKSEHTFSELFNGEIVVGVYQSKALTLNITSPWPFDELVVVLEGELRLHANGDSQTRVFPAGAMTIVPRGFTGTWEMAGDTYRELFVVEQKAYIRSLEPGALLSN